MGSRFAVGIENAGAFLRRLALGYNGNRLALAAGWRRPGSIPNRTASMQLDGAMTRLKSQVFKTVLPFFLLALFGAACGEETNTVTAAFERYGLDVGAESDERLVYIGAPQDTSVKVNGRDVLIYRFPDRDDLREGIRAIEDIIRAGTGLWGYDPENPGASYHERGLYIVYFGDHPDAERMRQAMDAEIRLSPFEALEE